MTRGMPEGVESVGREDFPENKLGQQTYLHRFDPSKFRKDRDFHAEWIEGPVRFSIERHDHGDYWAFMAEPAGKATRMRSGYEPDSMTMSSGGSSGTARTTISPANKDFQEAFGEGDTIYVRTSVNLFHNPFEVRWGYKKEAEGHFGSIRTLFFTVDTPENTEHRISRDMVKSQLKTLARHAAAKAKHVATTKEGREKVTGPQHYHHNRVLSGILDTAYILGLREETSYATSVRKTGYSTRPETGDPTRLSGVAKWVGEKAYSVGLIDKPKFIEHRERHEAQPPEPEPEYQQQPLRGPPKPENRDVKEKDNRCPECEGRYHKKDLLEDDYDQNYMSGTVYRCPDCESIVAGDLSYFGPEPDATQTRAGF